MVRLCLPSLAALALAACGDTVKIVECPPGTVPSGSQCLEVSPPDSGEGEVFAPDVLPDSAPQDSGATAADTTPEAADDTGGTDTTSEVAAAGATGAACVKNADCAGGTCLDWSGGYCTRLDCEASGCGAGETCLAIAGNHLCVSGCVSDADCRAPDQACKLLTNAGGTASVCLGVDAGAGGLGARCDDATDCAGGATCLASFPGGYCALLGCDVAGCPPSGSCVKVDGRPSCLLRCSGDADCAGEPGAERRCGVLQSVSGSPSDVCISGVEGKTLGESCRSDFECTSGSCQILGEGHCSQTGGPCFPETVGDDCNGAEFCQVTAESRVGLCSQPCALGGRTCPGASHCLAEGDAPRDAWCRPACSGPDDTGCNGAAGLVCAFGIPVSDSGQGRYACARVAPGSALRSCTGDATCAGGSCLLDGNSGYCTASCGEDSHCAFSGACVTGAPAGGDRCYRACFSSLDCPGGMRCEATTGASREVCVP